MRSSPPPLRLALGEHQPALAPDAWVAPGAVLTGQVDLAAGSSVWYTAVLRADGDRVVVGTSSNIQDGCILHADPGLPVRIGSRVTVGHRAVLHGCTVDDDVLIGMGAVILNGAHIGAGSLVAAGAVVGEGVEVPPNTLVAGVPAKVRRETTPEEREMIKRNAEEYLLLRAKHAGGVAT